MRFRKGFGQADAVTGAVAAGVTGAVVAAKTTQLQSRFAKQIRTDQDAVDYIKDVVSRFRSVGNQLVSVYNLQPGTSNFEAVLQARLKPDMMYRGNCTASIYHPLTGNETATSARQIWGLFNRSGTIEKAAITPEAGVVWAAGCKNAMDDFKITYINKIKDEARQDIYRDQADDLEALGVLAKVGLGVLVVTGLLAILSVS